MNRTLIAFFTGAVLMGCATTSNQGGSTLQCPVGSQPNYSGTICEDVCTAEHGMYRVYDPVTRGCKLRCEPGTNWDRGECVDVCQGGDWVRGRCLCPQGYTLRERQCITEARAADLDAEASAEESRLRAQYKPRFRTTTTPSCPSGQEWDKFKEMCLSICKNGTWDVHQSTCRCPPGMRWWSGAGKCVDR